MASFRFPGLVWFSPNVACVGRIAVSASSFQRKGRNGCAMDAKEKAQQNKLEKHPEKTPSSRSLYLTATCARSEKCLALSSVGFFFLCDLCESFASFAYHKPNSRSL
jgi:hypothetical protein